MRQGARSVVAFSTIVELAVGLALMVAPATIVTLLSGNTALDDGLPLGRCFGIAIFALGIACWPDGQHSEFRVPAFRALLAYNALIALYLAWLGAVGQWGGLFLWLGAGLHAAVALALGSTRRWRIAPQ